MPSVVSATLSVAFCYNGPSKLMHIPKPLSFSYMVTISCKASGFSISRAIIYNKSSASWQVLRGPSIHMVSAHTPTLISQSLVMSFQRILKNKGNGTEPRLHDSPEAQAQMHTPRASQAQLHGEAVESMQPCDKSVMMKKSPDRHKRDPRREVWSHSIAVLCSQSRTFQMDLGL